ncbi:hypothetical protein GCM10027289_23050 [Tsukamurella serpentis]
MGSPDEDRIRHEARGRIAGRPSMVLDGDPIEELARAHERHAERLDSISLELADVGKINHLGNTSEGLAATHNIGVAVHTHDQSVVNTLKHQADQARAIAAALREIDSALKAAESSSEAAIKQAAQ